MTSQQLQDFQRRSIAAENMVKTLQKQLNDLQQQRNNSSSANQLNNSNEMNESKDNKWPYTIQPDDTYPVWHTPYNQSQLNEDDNIMVINSLCGPNTKVPFIPKNGRLGMCAHE